MKYNRFIIGLSNLIFYMRSLTLSNYTILHLNRMQPTYASLLQKQTSLMLVNVNVTKKLWDFEIPNLALKILLRYAINSCLLHFRFISNVKRLANFR